MSTRRKRYSNEFKREALKLGQKPRLLQLKASCCLRPGPVMALLMADVQLSHRAKIVDFRSHYAKPADRA